MANTQVHRAHLLICTDERIHDAPACIRVSAQSLHTGKKKAPRLGAGPSGPSPVSRERVAETRERAHGSGGTVSAGPAHEENAAAREITLGARRATRGGHPAYAPCPRRPVRRRCEPMRPERNALRRRIAEPAHWSSARAPRTRNIREKRERPRRTGAPIGESQGPNATALPRLPALHALPYSKSSMTAADGVRRSVRNTSKDSLPPAISRVLVRATARRATKGGRLSRRPLPLPVPSAIGIRRKATAAADASGRFQSATGAAVSRTMEPEGTRTAMKRGRGSVR